LPAAGTPYGDQLLDLFQFPLVGFAVLPDGPFQVFVAIKPFPQSVLVEQTFDQPVRETTINRFFIQLGWFAARPSGRIFGG
jgi:hypothetical protein